MSSEPKITLLDIPSTTRSKAWNPNTWKARTVLNHKRIPYKTEWISYPDIASTLKKLGVSPTSTDPDGNPLYTLPAIVDLSGDAAVVIMDSLAIAEYLDEKYPERPVLPKAGRALQYIFEETFKRIVGPHLGKLLLPPVWNILDERSQVYFRETRERWYGNGKPLEEWSPEGPIRDGHWALLKQGFDTLAMILDKNGPGVIYVAGGTEPTRADMIIVSHLAWLIATTPDDWERVRLWNDGRWGRLWEISEPWRAVH
ncbi:hypothetical protein JB92DRAFT_1450842 [Gautieria morchelliformis]|nr:hypothetical protein JB92DRAFT_1450842 [Gautieria morchelliformis]